MQFRANDSINRAHRQADFRNTKWFGRNIKREQLAIRRIYTRPKTKRWLTIRHAATMIPRVTIPASGSGQIQRKARRERERERERARERKIERREPDYPTDDLLDFANTENLIRYPWPLVDHARRTGKPRETVERRSFSDMELFRT